MTTPNEFLQFAKEMGLGRIKSTPSSSSSPPPLMPHNNGCTTVGLSVLNNLCRLIEQVHDLKSENNRLRANLELVEHVQQYQKRFILKNNQDKKKEKNESIISSTFIHDEEKSDTLSPTNSLKYKSSLLRRELKGANSINNQDSLSVSHIDHDQCEPADNHSVASSEPNRNNWAKVRHALKFTLRRKHGGVPASAPATNSERQIPTISISVESDDDHLQDNKLTSKKKKKKIISITTTTDNRQTVTGDDTDQEDESIQYVGAYHKGNLYVNEISNSASMERQEASSTSTPPINLNMDDEALLTRKPSKIARYRRKIRSKLVNVKKQFSDQNTSSSSMRRFNNSHTSIFDDIGSGLNHALLTVQLAPALTKSYQQKMHEWETMQKSQFLVNYRRQSIIPKMDLISNSRKTSLIQTANETSENTLDLPTTIDNGSSIVDELNLELQTSSITLGPILSPNQRSLIAHQWREIMLEEISLRHYNEYLQKKITLLKQLEANLKMLKTNIFCTNNLIQRQTTVNMKERRQYQQSHLPPRCRSLQSLIAMPASWILAVQSATYSDVLDGTSNRATERAILFNNDFFDQLEHFKRDRRKFQEDTINDLQSINFSTTANTKTIEDKTRSKRARVRRTITQGSLRKLSLLPFSEFPQYFLPDPVLSFQTIASQAETTSNTELLSATISNDTDLNNKSLVNNLNKNSKRSRFDIKKTLRHSKSACINQLNSWFQRHRQQQQQPQNSSTIERKSSTDTNIKPSYLTPTLFGSPRLARLRERLFKQHCQTLPEMNHNPIPLDIADDSDNRSQYDLPIRIYFPPLTTSISRHVHITDADMLTSTNEMNTEQSFNLTTPISYREYPLKPTTAKERRESFATLSNVFNNNKYL
ncbi:unnamed protein product [Rotaria magnacalcarata]|uniref:Uncharacterized protein n=7 Tax=Rotaria magnacalcarata TaxID=392030 RepID=A0A815BP27_9BILA|nr:unnamed protein product [Rotaria magnacalcarata]CAF2202778.1 unnamed protein product [Rotaria magnacalcarata]CAF3829436.1 unnamed protein product [Rotaria magnacalcarata]